MVRLTFVVVVVSHAPIEETLKRLELSTIAATIVGAVEVLPDSQQLRVLGRAFEGVNRRCE